MARKSGQATTKATKTGKDDTITFRRQFNKEYKGDPGEKNTLPSMTQPDQSLTVAQLMKNHTRGTLSGVSEREPQYFDQEIPNFDDITERKDYIEMLETELKEQETLYEQQKKDEEQAALTAQKQKEAEDLEKAEKLLKSKEKPPQKEE